MKLIEENRPIQSWVIGGSSVYMQVEKKTYQHYIARKIAEANEDGGITIAGLQLLASSVGVANAEKLELELDLIKAIQAASGQMSCFQDSLSQFCRDGDCPWKYKCKKLVAEWNR